MLKIKQFKVGHDSNLGDHLHELHDLCKVIMYNLPRCPDLQNLNLASELEELLRKLPVRIQNEWRKLGHAYENQHGGYHPPFSAFVNFVKTQARLQSNRNYETVFHDTMTTKASSKQSKGRYNIQTFQTAVKDTVYNKEYEKENEFQSNKSQQHL